MIIIQILLICAVLLLMVVFLRNHGTTRTAAGVKIGFVLFILFGVLAVLQPNLMTGIAELVGVGRGTDLLLYGLVVAFAFAVVNTYLRFKELELRHARLARAVALQNAERPQDDQAQQDVPATS